MTISVCCFGCKRGFEEPGTPYTYNDIWGAALRAGWSVEARRCFCRECRPEQGAKEPETGEASET